MSLLGHKLIHMATITPTKALAQVIDAERDRQNISTRRLAELSRMPNSTLHRSISGDWPRPLRWDELVAIADALSTTASALANRADALVSDAA